MYCIYANILGVQKFVCEFTRDTNGRYIITGYSLIAEEAIKFDSLNAAANRIEGINNQQMRDFKVLKLKPKDVGGKKIYNNQKDNIHATERTHIN